MRSSGRLTITVFTDEELILAGPNMIKRQKHSAGCNLPDEDVERMMVDEFTS
jgi:hypothetical protein